MKIERINSYTDFRFRDRILKQHGAYLINDEFIFEFEIIGESSAIIYYNDYLDLEDIHKIIDKFRFFSEHINLFYDSNMKLIKKFEAVKKFKLEIDNIQPSQFFVDKDKFEAVSTFIISEKDVVIPVLWCEDIKKYVVLDGHTRLLVAKNKSFKYIFVYESAVDDYIFKFVKEARKRKIFNIKDLEIISHDEYTIKWNKFCEDFLEIK